MDVLAKHVFIGTWRSFKLFKRTGDILLDSPTRFREVEIDDAGSLTMRFHSGNHTGQMLHTTDWQVILRNKRHYLEIPAHKVHFEVITINHTVMVLGDMHGGEKTFYAKLQYWPGFVASNKEVII